MGHHVKKMVAPLIITVLTVLYLVGTATCFSFAEDMPLFVKVLFILVPLILSGIMIGVAISRIREIRSGEEDDLSKY